MVRHVMICALGAALYLATACDDAPQTPGGDGPLLDAGPGGEAGVDGPAADVGPAADGAGDQSATLDGAGACSGGGLGPGTQTLTMTHGGKSRGYIIFVPKGNTNTTPAALVVNFHGFSSNAAQQVLFSAMNSTASKEGFVAVYPTGLKNSWNAGGCCGDSAKDKIDDVGFARALVADVSKRVCIDKKRVFATGMSNGGMMTHRLACEAPDLFAAFAPVAAHMWLGGLPCTPSRPIPIIQFYGTLDMLVPYKDGLSTFKGWATRNGCTDAKPTQTYKKGIATCKTYKACKKQVEVTMCTILGGGHCWFGQLVCPTGLSTIDIRANKEMWAFFKRFPMP